MDGQHHSNSLILKVNNLANLEGLDDFNALMERELFDEVPLYSRYSHLSFFNGTDYRDQTKILIQYMYQRIPYVYAYAKEYFKSKKMEFFCMVSITNWEEFYEEKLPACPNLFVTNKRDVIDHMIFNNITSEEGFFVKKFFADDESALVFENNSDIDLKRVYVVNKNYYFRMMQGISVCA